ncbi:MULTISPECIES: hypothetical protein [Paenibacillus]|jgi:hypothetical protein|uniref:Uncharacterized protein n=3 Tax=Paenibacillus TaxID=44249 RepID=G4HE08_9BACL|nr:MULTISPECIES: hypothetical protein [Paenibacillus]ANY72213.1 hypothetical protein BBD41_06195 [Paenibacillus ihbetae]EHB65077.1 hypothetical protein PaelaDRAFT_2219 [Paenibacillus lactis 154]MBP1895130.1 hypothetical protein [Paenibacillus lactis]MCM3495633.1 hypothetical protein [Paenibacillus lactis]OOC60480.1 hypothetical protein BBD40_00445 [Paenibacillus ihbetae]
MAEKNILAYFKSPEEAQHAQRKLQSLRVADMSIDRFSAYPGGELNGPMHPLTGDITSLTSMTQNSALSNRSAGILGAADPSASGMSDGGQDGTQGRDILLTVVLDEGIFDQAMRLIEESGGMV